LQIWTDYFVCIILSLLQMLIGNAEYHCLCVRYIWSRDNTVLIVTLTVALALLLFIIIIIISALHSRRAQAAQQKHGFLSDDNKDKHDYNTYLREDGTVATSL